MLGISRATFHAFVREEWKHRRPWPPRFKSGLNDQACWWEWRAYGSFPLMRRYATNASLTAMIARTE